MDNYLNRKKPVVSVVMPVYNTELYVFDAIESILGQTFIDFEFIIIDDASSDKSYDIINSFKDSRIKIIRNKVNMGIVEALNYGISISEGKYIARMDSDDISLPNRLELQYQLLENNPEIIMCGTSIKIINSNEIINYPLSHSQIEIKLLEGTTFAHPSVFIKKEIFQLYKIKYNPNFEPAEDYHLWTQLVKLGKIVNIDKVLLLYRKHVNQVSSVKAEKQYQLSTKIRLNYSNYFFNRLTNINYNNEINIEDFGLDELISIFNYFEKLYLNKIVRKKKLDKVILFQIKMLQYFVFSNLNFQNISVACKLIVACPRFFKYNSFRMKFSYLLKSILVFR